MSSRKTAGNLSAEELSTLVHAMELGYKAREHGMNLELARERILQVLQGARSPWNFYEGYETLDVNPTTKKGEIILTN